MVKHIVMWTFKPELDKGEVVAKMQASFAEWGPKVPGLRSLNIYRAFQGFDACLVSEHDDEAALEAYQTFPQHLEMKKFVASVRVDRASCDFVVE